MILTYGEIYAMFKRDTSVDDSLINDYRPCKEMYGVPNIPNAIIIWLNNDSRIIYIAKEEVR